MNDKTLWSNVGWRRLIGSIINFLSPAHNRMLLSFSSRTLSFHQQQLTVVVCFPAAKSPVFVQIRSILMYFRLLLSLEKCCLLLRDVRVGINYATKEPPERTKTGSSMMKSARKARQTHWNNAIQIHVFVNQNV